MMHKPILIKDLTLSFSHKVCFEHFTTSILPGSRIALIGRNGSGKSTLLTMLSGLITPTEGSISRLDDIRIGYVPQVPQEHHALSGGQQFNKALTQALAQDPALLLLDEPTNHLDSANRMSLIRMLQNYRGTLIVASHDTALLRATFSSFWHLDKGRISQFYGSYDDYRNERNAQRAALEHKLSQLNAHKEENHRRLRQEQLRAKKSRSYGEKQKSQNRWSPIVASSKARKAEETSGRRSHTLSQEKQELIETLTTMRTPEIILPDFLLPSGAQARHMVVSVREGSVGYTHPLVRAINFSLIGSERVGITGANGSGKSTFIKALRSDATLSTTGVWHVPLCKDIGYLDQHYATLPFHLTVLDVLKEHALTLSDAQARAHLNSFLFRKNEEVNAPIYTLSGGERVRLSLALIAALPPKLLILDEVSNNLDRETVDHVISVLQQYRGALIVVTHDEELLNVLNITKRYYISEGTLKETLPSAIV